MTKVSVLLPVYNTDPVHLKEAIDSILSQTFTDFELLILNDASPEAHVEKTVLSYSDKRIRYIRHEENSGIAKIRNVLIDLAQGEYLAVMDHDDISLPTRLEKQVAYMDANPEVAICGTAHKRFGKLFKNNVIRYPQDDADIRAELFFKCVVHHPSAMMRKEVLITHNIRYDESLISANDRKLYMDVSEFAKLHNLPDILCLYRLHAGMTSRTKRQAIVAEQKVIRKTFLEKMGAQLTPGQIDILNDYIMSGRSRIKNADTLKQVESVLSALVAANRQSHYLPAAQFENKCAKYFVKRCYNAAFYGRISSGKLLQQTILPVEKIKKPIFLKLINAFYKG